MKLMEFRQCATAVSGDPEMEPFLSYLGIRLGDAQYYLQRLTRMCSQHASQRAAVSQREFSRSADAYIFTVYGVLDAYSQLVVAAAGISTQHEIKFPLLATILEEQERDTTAWDGLLKWLKAIYCSEWYVELRRLRNVVNSRSVIDSPFRWEQAVTAHDWEVHLQEALAVLQQGGELLGEVLDAH